jgi:hypothetical protein
VQRQLLHDAEHGTQSAAHTHGDDGQPENEAGAAGAGSGAGSDTAGAAVASSEPAPAASAPLSYLQRLALGVKVSEGGRSEPDCCSLRSACQLPGLRPR